LSTPAASALSVVRQYPIAVRRPGPPRSLDAGRVKEGAGIRA